MFYKNKQNYSFRLFWIFILTIAGLAGNYFKFSLFFNVDFFFGSIFSLIILLRFGILPGFISTIIISSYTYVLLNHPYAIIIFTAEIVVVWLLGKIDRIHILVRGAIYWLLIGLPLVWFFYSVVMGLGYHTWMIVALKQATNGIFNIFISGLVVDYVPVLIDKFKYRSTGGENISLSTVSLENHLYYAITGLVLVSVLFSTIVRGREILSELETRINNKLNHQSRVISIYIDDWVNKHIKLAKLVMNHEDQLIINNHYLISQIGIAAVKRNNSIKIFDQSLVGLPDLFRGNNDNVDKAHYHFIDHDNKVDVFFALHSLKGYDNYVLMNMSDFDDTIKNLASSFSYQIIVANKTNRVISSSQDVYNVGEIIKIKESYDIIRTGNDTLQYLARSEANTTLMERWKSSFYVKELTLGGKSNPLSVIVMASVSPYQEELYESYIRNLSLLLFFFGVSAIVSALLSYYNSLPFLRLRQTVQDLPTRIQNGESVSWPRNVITEDVVELIASFRGMDNEIRNGYQRLIEMNDSLEDRVEQRTRELQSTNEKLRLSRERFEMALEGARDGLWDIDLVNKSTYYSKHFLNILGMDDYVPTNRLSGWLDWLLPDERKIIKKYLREFLRERKEIWEHTFQVRHTNGEYITVLSRGKVTYNDKKRPVRAVGFLTDITHQLKLENLLQISEEKIRILADSVGHMMIFSLDKNLKCVGIYGKWIEDIGFDISSATGKPVDVALQGIDGEKCRDAVDRCLKGEKVSYDSRVLSPRKVEVFMQTNMSPIFNNSGEVTGIVGISYDITEGKLRELKLLDSSIYMEQLVEIETRKRLEQQQLLIQQSRLAAMGEMIGSIAHQWKQPLSVMHMLFQEIGDSFDYGELDEERINYIMSNGIEQAEYMAQTVDDFRDFFKPTRKQKVFRVDEAVNGVLKLISVQLKNHGVVAELKVSEPASELKVIGFPNEFKQAVLNLLTNARDAILSKNLKEGNLGDVQGTIRVNISKTGDTVEIIISDDGEGIPEDILPRIFEPYITGKGEKGTGIGLYISRLIINKMHGEISVSNFEQGARFTIRVKAAADDA